MASRPQLLWLGVIIAYTSPLDLFSMAFAQERYCSSELLSEGSTFGMCGRDLSDTIDMLCNLRKKRSAERRPDLTVSPKGSHFDDVTVPKSRALSFLDVKKRSSHGVHCECCVHSCNYSEMMEYCPRKKKRGSLQSHKALHHKERANTKSPKNYGFQKRGRFKFADRK